MASETIANNNGYRAVPVELGGRWRTIRFDLNALCSVEAEIGHSIMDMDSTKMGFRGQRALLWAGLLAEDPKLRIEEVGTWLTPMLKDTAQYSAIMQAVGKAYAMAFPDPKDDGAPPNEPAAGTGEKSTS